MSTLPAALLHFGWKDLLGLFAWKTYETTTSRHFRHSGKIDDTATSLLFVHLSVSELLGPPVPNTWKTGILYHITERLIRQIRPKKHSFS